LSKKNERVSFAFYRGHKLPRRIRTHPYEGRQASIWLGNLAVGG